jgi:protein phosphatase
MPSIRAAALTDIGRVRRQNEDRFIFDEAAQLYGIADGVGGLPGGADAAQQSHDDVTAAIKALAAGAEADLTAIVHHTNQAVLDLGRRISPGTGIGTTLTFGYVRGAALHIAHVGDSRCYGWRGGEIKQLTEDHSVENEARQRRARGEVVYYHESNRNALTRCIGQPTPPKVDLITQPLQAGDRYLFCTDGVTRMVTHSEIGELLGKAADPAVTLKELIALAVRRGGPDNATGVLAIVDGV